MALLLVAALAGGCDEYPLSPTFCDDWCRATLRGGCDSEPENCVRECELTRATGSCFALQRDLLECYEAAPNEAFVCVEQDFGTDNRIADGHCREERDLLFDCEAPGIGECLSLCRGFQESQLSSFEENQVAGAEGECVVLDVSCESLCWNLLGLSADPAAAFAADASAGDSQGVADESVACIAEQLTGCLSEFSSLTLVSQSLSSLEELVNECVETDGVEGTE